MRKIKSKISIRVETGALQINDDWAGVFVRGDDCPALLDALYKIYPQVPFGSGLSNLYSVIKGLEEICGSSQHRLAADLLVRAATCDECGGVVGHSVKCSKATQQTAKT